MTISPRWLALALILSLAPVTFATAGSQQPSTAPTEARAAQQVLVMLRLPPTHLRPGGSYSGDYADTASQSARRRIAKRIAARSGMRLAESWPMPLLGVDCFVFDVPLGKTPKEIAEALSHDRDVAWAQPMQIYQGRGIAAQHGDPLYAVQPAAAWHLDGIHRFVTGRGASIAIVDSKVDIAHPDLAGQFLVSRDFLGTDAGPPEQHGTGVAGVVAAKADNGIGIAGVAPGARLMALRACWEPATGPTLCDSLSLAKALHFAIERNAQIINLSLAGPADPLLTRLLDIALARHISIVAAYDTTLPAGGFPASMPGVIPVIDESLRPGHPGVYGAPGQDIPTTEPGGKWYIVSGSSYAVAHVSGLLALAREQDRGRQPHLVVRPGRNSVDPCATLATVARLCDCCGMSSLDQGTATH